MVEVIDFVTRARLQVDAKPSRPPVADTVLSEVAETAVSSAAANVQTAQWLLKLAAHLQPPDSSS